MSKKKKVENTENVSGLCNTNNNRKKNEDTINVGLGDTKVWQRNTVLEELKQAKRVANHFDSEEYLIRKISWKFSLVNLLIMWQLRLTKIETKVLVTVKLFHLNSSKKKKRVLKYLFVYRMKIEDNIFKVVEFVHQWYLQFDN